MPDLATAQELQWGAVRATTFVDVIDNLIAPDQPVRLYDDYAQRWRRLERGQVEADPARPAAGRRHRRTSPTAASTRWPSCRRRRRSRPRCPKGSDNVEAVDSAMRAFTADGTIDQSARTWVGDEGGRRRALDPAAAHDHPHRCTAPRSPPHSADREPLSSPTGPAWEFLVLFLVVIIGPPLLERARLPGIIGLLLGGFVIGPYGLNVIGAGNTTVPELGQLGLLYLMFVAGVELDLALLRVHRRCVVLFWRDHLPVPALARLDGRFLDELDRAGGAAARLADGLPYVAHSTRRSAMPGSRATAAVATAVGATVLTDTASLVVLAAVSGSQLVGGVAGIDRAPDRSRPGGAVVFSLVVLPRLVRLAFRYLGTDRVVRYLLAIASFLAAATVAACFGIEGIVGAFFAGLGLNRLVPNEGPLMDRIDFFGSAVFVPIFLVSVGMLLAPERDDPGRDAEIGRRSSSLASLGGKTIATPDQKGAAADRGPQASLMLGLTVPQAAATLAATVIGFNIGLFDQSVVNAVLVLILVSIVVGHADRRSRQGRRPGARRRRARSAKRSWSRSRIRLRPRSALPSARGSRPRTAASSAACSTARRPQARAASPSWPTPQRRICGRTDTDPMLLVHGSLAEAITNVAAQHPSFVSSASGALLPTPRLAAPGRRSPRRSAPVGILIGDATRSAMSVLDRTPRTDPSGRRRHLARRRARLADRGQSVATRRAGDHPFTDLRRAAADRPGELVAVDRRLRPAEGAALILVLKPPPDRPDAVPRRARDIRSGSPSTTSLPPLLRDQPGRR